MVRKEPAAMFLKGEQCAQCAVSPVYQRSKILVFPTKNMPKLKIKNVYFVLIQFIAKSETEDLIVFGLVHFLFLLFILLNFTFYFAIKSLKKIGSPNVCSLFRLAFGSPQKKFETHCSNYSCSLKKVYLHLKN